MFLYLFLIGEILGAFPQAPIIANQPGPQFLSIWVNDTIEEELVVRCQPDSMCIEFGNGNMFFNRLIFQQNNYVPEDFWLPNPCMGNRTFTGDSSTYCIEPGMKSDATCGLSMRMNDTHVTYLSTLQTDQERRVSSGIWVENIFTHFEIPFTCVFPLETYAQSSFKPAYASEPVVITGIGNYTAQMLLYESQAYTNVLMTPPLLDSIDVNGEITRINAEVNLMSGRGAENIALELRKCWATPTENAQNEQFILIENGCSKVYQNQDLNMNVQIHNSGNEAFARFSFDIFGFVISNSTNLHCIVEICYDSWCNIASEQCPNESNLQNLRKRRSIKGDVIKTTQLMISAQPSYHIQPNDFDIPKVDHFLTRFEIEAKTEMDFVSISLVSGLAAMSVLLVLLVQKTRQNNSVKTI